MKKILLSFFALFSFYQIHAQLVVNNTNTVNYYVQNVLLGVGVTASNITFNGLAGTVSNQQIGEFNALNTNPYLGIDSGVVMASGNVTVAVGPNNSGSSNIGGTGAVSTDPDLQALVGGGVTVYDQAVLEFDFIPTGDTINFDYIFGSEEYPEYVNAGYNDAFGFFLSGPGIAGPYSNGAINIALIPGTTTPVTIDNVNSGSNPSYYVDNTGNTGPQSIQFDGYTTRLTAIGIVQCGVQYHIKLAIADAGDALWDSGVFLEAGSFSSNGTVDAAQANVPSDITLCGQPYTVNFSAGPNPPPNSYWDFGDGIGIDTATNPMYTYLDTGTYVVMYVAIDSSACIPTDTAYFNVNIIQNDSLDAQFYFPPYDPCVDSLTIQLDFTGSGADSLYWNLGNGTQFFNDTSVTYTYTTPGTYVVTLEAYDTLCNNMYALTDTVYFNPVVTTVTASPPPDVELCSAPYLVNFTGNSPTPPNSYWDFGDGIGIDTAANPMYTYADTGTYVVTYVVIDSSTCNIADTAYFTVTVSQADTLDAQFNFPPYDPCVDSLTIQLDFTGSGADSIYWDMGDGSQFFNDTSVLYTYVTPGVYIVTFQAFDFQCNNSKTITDTVYFNPVKTTVNAVVPPNILMCSTPFVVNFTGNNPAPPNSYWDFGDGSGTSTQTNPTYTYSNVGIYTVMYVAIDSSTCNIADTAFFNVELVQAPTFSASLDFNPPLPCEADSFDVQLTINGQNIDSIYWNMGDGTQFYNIDSINYLYTDAGTYTITLTAYNYLCNIVKTFSDEVTFVELTETSSIIPNVFTPNGDGMNDELVITGIDLSESYSLMIFNRWGTKVYEGSNADEHWDGGGHESGVYFYELRFTDVCSHENKLITGYVTLLK